MKTITVDSVVWEVEECTLDSAVVNDHVQGKQTVAFRLVCTRSFDKDGKQVRP